MKQRSAVRGMFAVLAATGTLLVAETAARADDREQCASAADQAQQLRDEGKYRRAREQLLLCARDVCPAPIKRDCLDWLTQVENTAPTVVFGAKDGARDLSDVKVYVDGAPVTDRLDGKPVQMDLGKHVVKFEYQGQTKEEEVIIGAGQKNRNVTVTFGAAAGGAGGPTGPAGGGGGGGTEPAKEGSIAPALVVGGIGILALGSFAIFGLGGKSDVSDLEKTCKPHCAETDVDKARTKLIIADISLGVGIVALGVATYLFVTRPKVDADVKTGHASAKPPAKPATGVSNVSFDFGAVTGGAMGSFGARF
ncbi:MAG: hypothetical protein JWP87_3179 [Labilithrix sp.]|nr:hypothetical protein [Labilithrix sp.]